MGHCNVERAIQHKIEIQHGKNELQIQQRHSNLLVSEVPGSPAQY